MKLIYYKSLLCPRCIPTNRLVGRLRHKHPEVEIEEIEVLAHLSETLRDGVLMLPTLIAGTQRFHHAPRLEELLAALEPPTSAEPGRLSMRA
jgi:hypothetical protein